MLNQFVHMPDKGEKQWSGDTAFYQELAMRWKETHFEGEKRKDGKVCYRSG